MFDINSASREELAQITGIGEDIADKIVEYRREKNGFQKLKELKCVAGIGEKKFSRISSELTVTVDQENQEKNRVLIEFDPADVGGVEPEEVHLVGTMNNWNPRDKTYPLQKNEEGIWCNIFHFPPGTEYKIMWDSASWEEDKYMGFYGENFMVE